MDALIFEYRDYKTYLTAVCDSRPRGFRKALAQSAGCQTAYISHVLNGSAHLSLEQASAVADSIGLSKAETRYFLLLCEYTRAGTTRLRELLQEQLDEMREKHLLIKERIGVRESLTAEHQSTYYSSWQYSAVHMAITIPALQTSAALARALRIPPRKLRDILDFLVSAGLAVKAGDRFEAGTARIHLEKDSPLIPQHHANWRLQALASAQSGSTEEAIHYSSVFTLSAQDIVRIRAAITSEIESWVRTIKESKEEQVYSLAIDFFRVDRP